MGDNPILIYTALAVTVSLGTDIGKPYKVI